jgi:hypothetical protein
MIHRSIPGHFSNPAALAMRILASRNGEALYALVSAAMQVALTPVDMAMSIREKRIYERAAPPRRPIVFVVGPPRSGTTVVAQVLTASLPVAYFNNLTSIFPRSPIVVNKLVRRPFRNERIAFRSFYGKSKNWYGPNDALYFWDRWFGSDRTAIPAAIGEPNRSRLIQFFGAFQEAFPLPLIAKNNNMNAYANIVAPLLPTAVFVCMRRNPLYLAQALLKSRRDIHGSDETPYGIEDPDGTAVESENPYQSVCRQVAFYQTLERAQSRAIGPERYWPVDYEAFCDNPRALVDRVANHIAPGESFDPPAGVDLNPFPISRHQKISDEEFELLTRELERRSLLKAD